MTTTTVNAGLLTYFRGSDIWLDPTTAATGLAAHGIPNVRIPDLSATKVKIARARFAAGGWRKAEMRADVISEDADHIAIGLLRRTKLASGVEVGWVQFDAVRWDVTSGWTGGTTAEGGDLVAFGKKWQTHLEYYWVRSTVVFDAVLSKIGIPMGGGGILYVPADKLADFERLSSWTSTVPGAKLYAIKIDGSDEGSVGAVGSAVQEHALGQVEDVLKRLGEWREKAKARTSTLDRLLGELGDVRGRAIALSEALRFSTDEVEAAIGAAEGELRRTLDEATAAEEPTPTAPEVPAAPVVEAPSPAAETVVEPDPEASGPAALLALIPSVDHLEATASARELRQLCHKLGIKGYAKQPEATMVSRILAEREKLAAAV